jgi:hypothetical protein
LLPEYRGDQKDRDRHSEYPGHSACLRERIKPWFEHDESSSGVGENRGYWDPLVRTTYQGLDYSRLTR